MDRDHPDLNLPEDNVVELHAEPQPDLVSEPPSRLGFRIGAIALALVAVLAVVLAWNEHRTVRSLTASSREMSGALDEARQQANTLSARLNAVQAEANAARAAAESAQNQPVPVTLPRAPKPASHHVAVRRKPVDDPRWQQVQSQLGEQQKQLSEHQKQLDETQASLDQAKTDLQGKIDSARSDLGTDIARNHDELVALEKKGERNFFEFDFPKSKDFHHAGPVSISLRKTNSKHEYCDLEMLVNDQELSRKHVSLYEAVMLYPEGYAQAIELVINHIDKDSIHGYVSEPKYRAAAQTAAQVAPAATPPLEHRPDEGH